VLCTMPVPRATKMAMGFYLDISGHPSHSQRKVLAASAQPKKSGPTRRGKPSRAFTFTGSNFQ
jgi:hypothetical protein